MCDSIQMTLVPFYCSESVLRMFIEHYRTQIVYLKWYYRRDGIMEDDSICKYCRHYKTKKLNGRVVSERGVVSGARLFTYRECDLFSKKLIVRIKELLGLL